MKAEWGSKRTCLNCGARFYDMGRAPIACPKCGSLIEPEAVFKTSRRSAAPVVAEPKAPPAPIEEEIIEVEVEGDDLEVVEEDDDEEDADVNAIDGGDEDESGLIEDASDLGEDDDDMAEVMEHIDENLEDEA